MRLQTRLTFAFLVFVLALVGSVGWVLYGRIHDQFDDDFRERVETAREGVRALLVRDAERLRTRVLGAARDPRVSELAQDLEHGRFDAARKRQALAEAEALRAAADVDVLWIFDDKLERNVIAAAHRSDTSALPPSLAGYLRRGLAEHVVVEEPVTRGGRPVVVPVLEVGVREGRLVLVGGRVIGQEVAGDLRAGASSEVEITIRGREGRVVASTLAAADPPERPDGYETTVVVHKNAGEREAALSLSVHVSRMPLERRLRTLFEATAAVGALSALLALLLGALVARLIARPIGALVEATRRIAAGERDLSLGRRGDEIGELMAAFEAMAEELGESERRLWAAERVAAWQEIARELAHEIKNPLTPIQMAIETVRRTYERKHPRFEEVFEESTRTILEEVERLKKIVSEFSQFARLPRPSPTDCDLNDLVHQSVTLYREAADGIEVVEELSPDLGTLQLDPERMTQVVQNLLQNALQATRAVDRLGRVVVRTRVVEGGAELSVEDNGGGIPAEDLDRVFTPYFTTKAGGTGLGLAVVHRIVTGHDGRIGVQSRVGEGTRFVVRLPRGVTGA